MPGERRSRPGNWHLGVAVEEVDSLAETLRRKAKIIFLASLRIGESLFVQPVDDPGDAVFNQGFIEITQKTEAFVGEAQIGEELLLVDVS